MRDWKCPNCKRLLFRGEFVGRVEIKCRACKKIFEFEDKPHVFDVIEGLGLEVMQVGGTA